MAFYRCGGGGVPASVKTGMNSVLNKKFGTSTTYDPAGWPDDVNLLGPLPERTASGSIAHIEDGADAVPLKSWEVTLPASLDGYSEVNGTKNTGTDTPETQYTASLGRTIYGGVPDVVKGEGTEQYKKVKVSDLTWTKQTASGRDYFIANISQQENTNTHDVVIGIAGLTYAGMVTVSAMSDKSLAKWLQSLRIYDTSISSVSDLLSAYGNGEIVFYLKDEEQIDFTFTPITPTPETALGTNNFRADEGDTEVTYRADINLALGGQ